MWPGSDRIHKIDTLVGWILACVRMTAGVGHRLQRDDFAASIVTLDT